MSMDEKHGSIILQRMFENGVCSDQFTLISGKDGQRISIHRSILTAVSKYFRAALGPHFQEGDETESTLEDTDGQTVKAIVDFCYTGRIELTEGNVTKFQAIASSIEFDLLEEKCSQFYAAKLSVDNSVDTLIIADKYSDVGLRQRALDLICESFETVPMQDIQRLGHELMQELLKCDKIQAPEELVFKRLFEWFKKNEEERKKHMPEMLKLIRLEYVPSQLFGNNSLKGVYKQFDCSELLYTELNRRAVTHSTNIAIRRCRAIFCLFASYKGYGGVEHSAVKIEKYNSVLNQYEEASEITLGDRMLFGVILQKNKIYVLGGFANDVYLKTVSAFDLDTGEEEILPEMNLARSSFTSIFFEKYIYIFGGKVESGDTNSCERFDTETKTWKVLQPMTVARSFPSVAVLKEYIYVAGGQACQKYVALVELYDPKKDAWVKLAPMNNARAAFALFELNGFLYATGSEIEKYDPWKNCWAEIGSFEKSRGITSAIETDGEIVAIVKNGEFGQIKFDENGACSFVPLSKSKYESNFFRRHYLSQN